MFYSLPQVFKKQKLNADVRCLLLLLKVMDKGLVHTIGDAYVLLRGVVTSDPREFGPFSIAFYEYFIGVPTNVGESLNTSLLNSHVYLDWKSNHFNENKGGKLDDDQLLSRFLTQVHMSSFDIKRVLDGERILKQNLGQSKDEQNSDHNHEQQIIEEAADYRNKSLAQLIERLEQIANEQKTSHIGGSHWIGKAGVSPFGSEGAAIGGIRIDGDGRGKMAKTVINDKRYFPVEMETVLNDDNVDAALAILKGIEEESSVQELDICNTVKEGVKQGGLFLPVIKDKVERRTKVLLIIDNGGLSMLPHVARIKKLFSKMKTRFAQDLKTYYYHNTIHEGLYVDKGRTQLESLKSLKNLSKEYCVFIIGDADMAPEELTTESIEKWQMLKKQFNKIAWLNPMKPKHWTISDTLPIFRRMFEMHLLTPKGIEKAVVKMNRAGR